MSGINGFGNTQAISSPYSPFDSAANKQQQPQATQQATGNAYYANDTYNVNNTSTAFDKAMAQFTGKPFFEPQQADTTGNNLKAVATQQPSLPAGVSQEEINWALGLEEKFKGGYKPTEQETQVYTAIAQKLKAGAQPQQAVSPTTQQPSLPAGISQQEIQWALGLEEKIKGGYQPNEQETQAYNALAEKLKAGATAQPQQAAPATQQPSLPAGISQQEIQWALGLEEKIKGGYQPNDQETQAYNALAEKLKAGATAQPQQAAPATQKPSLPAGISQQDVQWALDLEQKIKGGYQPNDQETQAYNALAEKLKAGATAQPQQAAPATQKPSLPAGVSQQEVQWALDLEQKVKGGYKPTDQESQTYQALAQKLTAAPQEGVRQSNKVTQDEVNWALQIEQKNKTGYTPTPQETSRYQDIANRLQSTGLSNSAAQNNKDWQAWSKPFEVPRSLFETTPRIMEVPTSLRASIPSLPTHTAVNQGQSLNGISSGAGAPAKQEIDWALQLEQKVKTGYKPTQADIAQYKDISDRLKAYAGTQQAGQAPAQQPNQTQAGGSSTIGTRFKNAWDAFNKK